MKTYKDPRHKARMKLIETLYAYRVNPETLELPSNVYKFDQSLFDKITESITENEQAIDSLIVEISKREIDDIKNIEYIILKISLAESFFKDITPYKVSIDEAIELARDYGDDASALFVSGVLGAAFDRKREEQNNSEKVENTPND